MSSKAKPDRERLWESQDVARLLRVAGDTTADTDSRCEAAESLGELGVGEASEPMLCALEGKGEDIELRYSAVSVLLRLGEGRAVEPLIRLLADREDDSILREDAALALGQLHDTRAFEPLLLVAHDATQDKMVRSGAVWASGELGDARAVPTLLSLLGEPTEDTGMTAVLSLGRLGDRGAVEPLVDLLWAQSEHAAPPGVKGVQHRLFGGPFDSNSVLRLWIVEALGNLGDERALPVLQWTREHDTGQTRYIEKVTKLKDAAAQAIARIKE